MEQEPNNEINPNDYMYFHFGENKVWFKPEVAKGYTHDEPEYDHIFIISQFTDGKPSQVVYLFREMFEHHGLDIEQAFELFIENDIPMIPQGEPDESDVYYYEMWKKEDKPHLPLQLTIIDEEEPSKEVEVYEPPAVPEAPALIEYGPTKERRIELEAEFMAYLIETNRGHLL